MGKLCPKPKSSALDSTLEVSVTNKEKYKNYIANKNWDLVKDLPYSDKAKCYMATQIELDKAVEQLINRLEEAGKLDDTVIIISGDHYPYGLTLDELNELSDYEKDDTFEKHRMSLLIWNNQMKQPVKVEKVASSLDIIPTVLNLFGIEYDSRLLIGRDILSDSDKKARYDQFGWPGVDPQAGGGFNGFQGGFNGAGGDFGADHRRQCRLRGGWTAPAGFLRRAADGDPSDPVNNRYRRMGCPCPPEFLRIFNLWNR